MSLSGRAPWPRVVPRREGGEGAGGDAYFPSSVAHRGETAYAPARWLGSVFASTSKLRRSQPKDDKCPNGSALSCGSMDTGRKGGF